MLPRLTNKGAILKESERRGVNHSLGTDDGGCVEDADEFNEVLGTDDGSCVTDDLAFRQALDASQGVTSTKTINSDHVIISSDFGYRINSESGDNAITLPSVDPSWRGVAAFELFVTSGSVSFDGETLSSLDGVVSSLEPGDGRLLIVGTVSGWEALPAGFSDFGIIAATGTSSEVKDALNLTSDFEHLIVVDADNTGNTDASPEINSAITSANGRRVVIPPGTYLLESPAIINTDDIELVGVGATLVAADGMDDACIAIYGANRVTVRGLRIDGNASNQTFTSGSTLPCGIVATDVGDLTIEYNILDDFAEHGIQVTSYGDYASDSVLNGNEGPVSNIVIQKNKITGFVYGGVLLQGGAVSGTGDAQHGFIRDNWISNGSVGSPAGGGSDVLNVGDGFHHAEVSGNYLFGLGAGVIAIEAHDRPGVRDTEDVRIYNNHIRGFMGTPPITVQHDNDALKDVVIRGNTMIQSHTKGSAPGYAIIDLTADGMDLENWTITDNTIDVGDSASGVAINGTSATSAGSRNLTIRGNIVQNCGWMYLQTSGPATELHIGPNRVTGRRGVVASDLGEVQVSGLRHFGDGAGDGIKLTDCGFVDISECSLDDSRDGIYLINCEAPRVANNRISDHVSDGVLVEESDDTDLFGAILTNNVIRSTASPSSGIKLVEANSGRVDYYLLKDNTISLDTGTEVDTGGVTGSNGVEEDNLTY